MTPEARAARERKQKIFVVVGGLFLLAMLAFQLPKLLGGSSPAEAAPTTTETTTLPGQSTPTGATPVALVDTSAGGDGRERSRRSRVFASKDPFVQQVATDSALGAVSGDGKGAAAGDTAEKPTKFATGRTCCRRGHDRHRERSAAGARARHEVPAQSIRCSSSSPRSPARSRWWSGSSAAPIRAARRRRR